MCRTQQYSLPVTVLKMTGFGATVCKTAHTMLSDRFLSVCLSVCLSCPICDVGVLWPNGCMDQDEI